MDDIDILSIHARIRKGFVLDKKKLPSYKEKLADIDMSLLDTDLKPHVVTMMSKARHTLANKIDDIEQNISRDFYNSKSNQLIVSYREMLNTAIKRSFIKKTNVQDVRVEKKRKIVREYLTIAQEYWDVDFPSENPSVTFHHVSCDKCGNTKKEDFQITDENVYTCQTCFSQQTVMRNTPSWSDIGRVNISQKYVYDRRVHYRDCILQYQGKQNCTISPKVYTDLAEHLEIHGALNGSIGDSQQYRYKNVTKRLLRDFLSELGYNKHYENIHLIHSILTGIKPDDISHLEEVLMDEFDQLTTVYDEDFKDLDRKSFVSTQCVLYQSLCKHGHPCKQSDFNIIKTPERKWEHDDILRHCFSRLGWSYIGLY